MLGMCPGDAGMKLRWEASQICPKGADCNQASDPPHEGVDATELSNSPMFTISYIQTRLCFNH